MLEPLGENTLRDYLTAFADGELDAAQTSAVWMYLADHPDRLAALRWVADQQWLTLESRRAITTTSPPELRERILAAFEGEAAAPSISVTKLGSNVGEGASARTLSEHAPNAQSFSRRRFFGYALATVAGLAVGATVAAYSFRATPDVIPYGLILNVGRTHAACSRLPEALHDATFEAIDASLADLARDDQHGKSNVPDLSALRFRFVGAGPCQAAKFHTVHLLYRTTVADSLAAVSIFLQADQGQFPAMKLGRVYRVSSSSSPFPTLAWRTGSVVYFLLADDEATEAALLQVVRPTPIDQIVSVAAR